MSDKNVVVLEEIAKWAGALVGDLMAADEDPTHYTSWSALREALEERRKIEQPKNINIELVLTQIGNTYAAIDRTWGGIWGKCKKVERHSMFIVFEGNKESYDCPFCKAVDYYDDTR